MKLLSAYGLLHFREQGWGFQRHTHLHGPKHVASNPNIWNIKGEEEEGGENTAFQIPEKKIVASKINERKKI